MIKSTLALIGVGEWGRKILASLNVINEADIKYICDQDYDSLAFLDDKYIKVNDWQELLDKNDLGAIVLATPPSERASIAVPFLEKGIPVFIEKPLSLSVNESLKIKDACARGGVSAFVGHIHLYNPAYIAFKKTINQHLGTPIAIYSEIGGRGPFRLDYSALWDWGPHSVSLILDLIKNKPYSVSAWGCSALNSKTDLYDIIYLKINFLGGLSCPIRVSRIDHIRTNKITVTDGKSIAYFDDTSEDNKVMLLPDFESGDTNPIGYEDTKPLITELETFISYAQSKFKNESNLQSGLDVVKVLEAAEKSIQANSSEIII